MGVRREGLAGLSADPILLSLSKTEKVTGKGTSREGIEGALGFAKADFCEGSSKVTSQGVAHAGQERNESRADC